MQECHRWISNISQNISQNQLIVKFRQNYMEVKLVEVLGAEKSEFSLSEKDLQEIFEVIHQKILQEDTQKKEQTDESDTNSENDKKQEGTDIASWNTENFRKLMLGDTPSDMFDVSSFTPKHTLSLSLYPAE